MMTGSRGPGGPAEERRRGRPSARSRLTRWSTRDIPWSVVSRRKNSPLGFVAFQRSRAASRKRDNAASRCSHRRGHLRGVRPEGVPDAVGGVDVTHEQAQGAVLGGVIGAPGFEQVVEALVVAEGVVETFPEVGRPHHAVLVLGKGPVINERPHALPGGGQPDRLGLQERGLGGITGLAPRAGVIERIPRDPVLLDGDAGGLRAVAREGDRREHRTELPAPGPLFPQAVEERELPPVEVILTHAVHADPDHGARGVLRRAGPAGHEGEEQQEQQGNGNGPVTTREAHTVEGGSSEGKLTGAPLSPRSLLSRGFPPGRHRPCRSRRGHDPAGPALAGGTGRGDRRAPAPAAAVPGRLPDAMGQRRRRARGGGLSPRPRPRRGANPRGRPHAGLGAEPVRDGRPDPVGPSPRRPALRAVDQTESRQKRRDVYHLAFEDGPSPAAVRTHRKAEPPGSPERPDGADKRFATRSCAT